MASLKKGEWSCYRGHFNGKENGHFTEVVGWLVGLCCLMTPGLSKDIRCHV